MSLEDDAARGIAAKQLLSNPLLIEAFQELAQEYTTAWQTTSSEDAAGRERMYRQLRALQDLEQNLSVKVQRGQMAETTMAERVKIAALKVGQKFASSWSR